MLIDVSNAKVHSSFGTQAASFVYSYSSSVLLRSFFQNGYQVSSKWKPDRKKKKHRAPFHVKFSHYKIHWKLYVHWPRKAGGGLLWRDSRYVSCHLIVSPLEAKGADRRTGYLRFFWIRHSSVADAHRWCFKAAEWRLLTSFDFCVDAHGTVQYGAGTVFPKWRLANDVIG